MSSRKRRTIHKVPPLKNRITSFSNEISKWKEEGYPLVSKERYHRRLNCCIGANRFPKCEFYKKLPLIGLCLKCGCYSVKLWLQTTKCPINKW